MAIVGLDLGKFKTAFCIMEESGVMRGEGKVEMSRRSMEGFLRTLPASSKLAMEATFNAGWVCDLAQELGLEPHLGHAKHLAAISQAKTKTDQIDARKLAHLLRTGFFPEVHQAARPVRLLKTLVRQRAYLVRQRTRAKNRTHTLLAEWGIESPRRLRRNAVRSLREIQVEGLSGEILGQMVSCVDFLDAQIKELDAKIDAAGTSHAYVSLLETIPGIGRYSALLLACEIDDIRRFPSARQLASYAGLVPTVRNSGTMVRIGHLSKEGNHWMKWILVESAQHAWRGSHPYHALHERIRRRKGSKVARIAVAREIVTAIHAMLMRGEVFRSPASRKEAIPA